MSQYPIVGERILRAAPSLAPAARLVRSCHERWDGRGYPDGLRHDQIPIGARIIAVCDAYHSMRSARSYRRPRSAGQALAELRRCAGSQFDPDVVAALADVGQASAYYDANGHYVRVQPSFFAFGLDSQNRLTSRPQSERYQGLQNVSARCPGGAVQPAPDGSAPHAVPGCRPTTTPPGP